MQSLTQISITTSSLTLLACGQPKPKALLPVTPYSFLINLGQGKETLNLHFNPRFDESTIVCNTSEGGRWGQEQRENHMCFSPGSEVKITITFQDKDFKVTLPDGHQLTFPNRLGHNQLHYLSMGGLQISSFKLE